MNGYGLLEVLKDLPYNQYYFKENKWISRLEIHNNSVYRVIYDEYGIEVEKEILQLNDFMMGKKWRKWREDS
ncbi:MAG: hypothetical protein ACRDA4_10715 [Filifactoraceae bacterium]